MGTRARFVSSYDPVSQLSEAAVYETGCHLISWEMNKLELTVQQKSTQTTQLLKVMISKCCQLLKKGPHMFLYLVSCIPWTVCMLYELLFFSVFNINTSEHLCVLWIGRWQLVFHEEPKGEAEDDNANDPFVLLHGVTLVERTNDII